MTTFCPWSNVYPNVGHDCSTMKTKTCRARDMQILRTAVIWPVDGHQMPSTSEQDRTPSSAWEHGSLYPALTD